MDKRLRFFFTMFSTSDGVCIETNNIISVKTSHSHVMFLFLFFKVDSISSLVECTWTLVNHLSILPLFVQVVVDKNLCSWQKLSPKINSSRPFLHSRKWRIWQFYVSCENFHEYYVSPMGRWKHSEFYYIMYMSIFIQKYLRDQNETSPSLRNQ